MQGLAQFVVDEIQEIHTLFSLFIEASEKRRRYRQLFFDLMPNILSFSRFLKDETASHRAPRLPANSLSTRLIAPAWVRWRERHNRLRRHNPALHKVHPG
jgi:hypothetical protein